VDRRLAAIWFSDIVGYTPLMAASEAAGLRARTRHRSLVRSLAPRHHGKIVDENGDELVLVFPSALDAVHCALAARASLREDAEIELRIGIHSGDVVFEGGRVYGDGVNVASRLRALAEPGGVVVSEPVFDAVKNQAGVELAPLGMQELKGVARPLAVYAVTGSVATPARALGGRSALRLGAVGAALVVAAATSLYLAGDRQASPPGLPASVAVLPFADMSQAGDQEYFADGVTEEIINALARIPDLRVVARTSAFAFKGKDADVRTIGGQLGVRSVVEGSVRRSGDRLRVTAQLISVADGYHLWSETYEREVTDIFAIQEEVATKVAEALSVRIGGRSLAPRPPRDLRAYELYLTGRQIFGQRSEASLRRALEYFEQALALSPGYAPALSGIADALLTFRVLGLDIDPAWDERAREAAQAAVRSDPSFGAAHASLGRLEIAGGRWNWKEAEVHLLRALELDPGYAGAHLWYGYVLLFQGRVEEGLAEIQRALELDPLAPLVLWNAGRFAWMTGDQERAIELTRRGLDPSPQAPEPRRVLADAYAAAGRERESAETILAGVPPPAQSELRAAYEAGGLRALLESHLRFEQERSGQPCGSRPTVAASYYAKLGDAEGVFRCLQEEAWQGAFLTFVPLNRSSLPTAPTLATPHTSSRST
jgi:TolB-like protein/class 3 adenylate cyclase/tetratricopeptide (TPR) repeat protein